MERATLLAHEYVESFEGTPSGLDVEYFLYIAEDGEELFAKAEWTLMHSAFTLAIP